MRGNSNVSTCEGGGGEGGGLGGGDAWGGKASRVTYFDILD